MTKKYTNETLIAVSGPDIQDGKRYRIYIEDGQRYFLDDAGDVRIVAPHVRRGGRVVDDEARPAVGKRVVAERSLFCGDVPAGTQGTVVAPRDPGCNVRWDNGYAVRDGSATCSPSDLRVIDSGPAHLGDWDTAPEWATHFGIEPTGRCWWFNKEPTRLDESEFRRGLDDRAGFRFVRAGDNLPVRPSFHVEARPVPEEEPVPAVTPQDDARYLLRIIKCPNSIIHGSFIRSHRPDGSSYSGSPRKDNRDEAKRFSYAEVVEFLRQRAEHNEGDVFEVILDYVKTGHAKPQPARRGNNGYAVGEVLRCELSAHQYIVPGRTYTVVAIDGDGDELIHVDGRGRCFTNCNSSERNEYTIVKGVK